MCENFFNSEKERREHLRGRKFTSLARDGAGNFLR